MKSVFFSLLFAFSLPLLSQRNKISKMAPLYETGYYINYKGDTIKGKIQTNLSEVTEFYRQFYFLPARSNKAKRMTTQRIKGYGFADKHYININYKGEEIFVRRMTDGRLRLYEYRFPGKVDGYAAVETDYFIRDTRAEGENAGLKEPGILQKKFYKKSLKPYMKDQLMLWTDLDKYDFNVDRIVTAINEFNMFYTTTAN